MIKTGTVGFMCKIEKEIQKLPHDLLWDGSEPLFEFKGSLAKEPFKIRSYTRLYEIFENETARKNTIKWFNSHQDYVKFHYDNRVNQASLETTDESWIYLSRRLPNLEKLAEELQSAQLCL